MANEFVSVIKPTAVKTSNGEGFSYPVLPVRETVLFPHAVLPLTVGDLATVTIGSRSRTGAATAEGREVVLGTAMLLVGENSREVAKRKIGRASCRERV